MKTEQRIRMVAVDLDGTLMDRTNHIARTAMDEIRRLNENGCMVVPCTGRFLRAVPQDLLQICLLYTS